MQPKVGQLLTPEQELASLEEVAAARRDSKYLEASALPAEEEEASPRLPEVLTAMKERKAQPLAREALQPLAQEALQPLAQEALQPLVQEALQPLAQEASQLLAREASQLLARRASQPLARAWSAQPAQKQPTRMSPPGARFPGGPK